MYIPIKRASKSIAAGYPASPFVGLQGLLSTDPRTFRDALSTVRIGRTFKTTARNRLPMVTDFLSSRPGRLGTVIDIGASDGSASITMIEALDFDCYCLTDKYMRLRMTQSESTYRLFDADGVLHMCQIGGVVFYLDPFRAWNSPMERLVTMAIGRTRGPCDEASHDVVCVTPELPRLAKKVQPLAYDCAEPWGRERADLVLVANFLDKFMDRPNEMAVFCRHIAGMLNPGATLVVADNEGAERATIFAMDGRPRAIHRLGGGSVSEQALAFDR
jgi:hypothetical protein